MHITAGRLKAALLALGASAALAAAGCGGGAAHHAAAGSGGGAPARTNAVKPPAAVPGIPQHDGGDHDADNNGGPTDGDGNL
jgi:hypothetical protein